MKRKLGPAGGSDRELFLGTRAHYTDGALYDHLYRRRRSDVRWYEKLAAAHGGPVLELGCGTGRITLPIARAGVEIVGVDLSRAMLDRAARQLRRLPAAARKRVRIEHGDLRTVRLGRRFPLVIAPFNALQHLYDRADWEAALATVRAHLAPAGKFVFDVLLPEPIVQARAPLRRFSKTKLKHPETKRPFQYTEAFVHERQRQLLFIYEFLDDETDPKQNLVVPVAHRQIYPLELEAILHYNGFAIAERHGGFEGQPVSEANESQVVVSVLR